MAGQLAGSSIVAGQLAGSSIVAGQLAGSSIVAGVHDLHTGSSKNSMPGTLQPLCSGQQRHTTVLNFLPNFRKCHPQCVLPLGTKRGSDFNKFCQKQEQCATPAGMPPVGPVLLRRHDVTSILYLYPSYLQLSPPQHCCKVCTQNSSGIST